MVMGYADPFETLLAFSVPSKIVFPATGWGQPRPQWAPIHPSTCSSKEMT
jgi:hypothetical protein